MIQRSQSGEALPVERWVGEYPWGQAADKVGAVVAFYEFDPYGNPVNNGGGDPYGYAGE